MRHEQGDGGLFFFVPLRIENVHLNAFVLFTSRVQLPSCVLKQSLIVFAGGY